MAGYMIARSQEQRRISTEWMRTTVHDYAAFAMQRQDEIIANARAMLDAVGATPDIRVPLSRKCSEELATFLRGRTRYFGIAIVELSGVVNCSTGAFGAIDLAQRSSVRRAIETDDFAIGEFQVDHSPTRQSLDVSLPLRDRDGRTTAIAVAALDLTRIGES